MIIMSLVNLCYETDRAIFGCVLYSETYGYGQLPSYA